MFLFVLANELLHPDGNVHNFMFVQAIVTLPCHCVVMKRRCLFVCVRVFLLFVYVRIYCVPVGNLSIL